MRMPRKEEEDDKDGARRLAYKPKHHNNKKEKKSPSYRHNEPCPPTSMDCPMDLPPTNERPKVIPRKSIS